MDAHRPAWQRRLLGSGLARHLAIAGASLLLVVGLALARAAGRASMSWNEPVGWASLILVAIALVIGPLARLVPVARGLLTVRREVGVWSGILAVGHVVLVFEEWAGWQLAPLWSRFQGASFGLDPGLAMGSLVGTVAVGYAVVLSVTSNDAAQGWLGWRWKAIQRTATTLMLLAVLHTAYFFYLDRPAGLTARHGLRHVASPFSLLLVGLVVLVAALRTVAFWKQGAQAAAADDEDNQTDKTPNDR